jgi:hypothetical protein
LMTIQQKYTEKLSSMPAPGTGCHPALLGAANVAALAGIPAEETFANIRASIPKGKRKISDKEVCDAVSRAYRDNANIILPNGERYRRYTSPKPAPTIHDGKTALQRIIEQSNISDEADLWELSEIRLDWERKDDTIKFLSILFEPSDMVFIGEREAPGIVNQNIRTVEDWIQYFKSGGKTAPFIIVNPLTGKPATKKSGDGKTYRGDGNISSFKYCLVEFDNLSRQDQIRFWKAAKLPKVALVDSGRKSIHCWLRLSGIQSMEDWQKEIRQELYEQYLIPLGVDSTCSNPARLSRLPGHLRDNGNYQKILWLAKPEKEGVE